METAVLGNRGRRKRRLAIYESEAAIVREIYELYLKGHGSRSVGFKEIAKLLNERVVTMRGRRWGIQKIYKILSARTLLRWSSITTSSTPRAQKKGCRSEWIATVVDPIIDPEIYERVRQRRRAGVGSPRCAGAPVVIRQFCPLRPSSSA